MAARADIGEEAAVAADTAVEGDIAELDTAAASDIAVGADIAVEADTAAARADIGPEAADIVEALPAGAGESYPWRRSRDNRCRRVALHGHTEDKSR